jgi:hypothetical protein
LAEIRAFLDPHITRINSIIDARTALYAFTGAERTAFADDEERLRGHIDGFKAALGFNDGIGHALRIFSTSNKPASADIKPAIKAAADLPHAHHRQKELR